MQFSLNKIPEACSDKQHDKGQQISFGSSFIYSTSAEVSSNILQCYYITTARELARMVGIRKAPILHHFSESLTGAATIRCFNQEDRFLKKTVGLVDDYSRVAFHNSATMEWLCVRVNFLFNLVFFFVLVLLVNLPRSSIEPSKLLLYFSIRYFYVFLSAKSVYLSIKGYYS